MGLPLTKTAELKFYEDGLEYIKSHHVEWVEAIEARLLQRLRSQTHELELLTLFLQLMDGSNLRAHPLLILLWIVSASDSLSPLRKPILTCHWFKNGTIC